MNKLMKKKKKGFTLIELIAVIAILAILAVIAVPRVISYVEKSIKVALLQSSRIIYESAEAAYTNGNLINAKTREPLIGKNRCKDFGAVKAIDAINFLKKKGIISQDKNFNNITDYRDEYEENQILLRDLKVLINTPVDDISVDSKGNLAGYFRLENGKSVYHSDGIVHRVN